MTDQSEKEFQDRRAAEEKALADNAPEIVRVVAHELLSSLHAQRANDSAVDNPEPPVQNTALDVAAVEGKVIVSDSSGQIASLTQIAADLTADLLRTNAREAGRQGHEKAK